MGVSRVFYFLGIIFCVYSLAKPFPEEAQRHRWDKGCAQFPEQISNSATLRKNPELKIYKADGAIHMIADVIFKGEKGESPEAVKASIEKILNNGEDYKKWVLPGINEKPGGGRYFVDINSLNSEWRPAEEQWVLTGPYTFQVLWVKKQGHSSLSFRKDSNALVPSCSIFSGLKNATRFVYRITPREDLLHLMLAEGWILPDAQGARVRFRLVAIPHPLVYSVMPETLLRYELEARAQRFFQNFIDFRRLGYVPSSTSNTKDLR